jgi:hypothetical protein
LTWTCLDACGPSNRKDNLLEHLKYHFGKKPPRKPCKGMRKSVPNMTGLHSWGVSPLVTRQRRLNISFVVLKDGEQAETLPDGDFVGDLRCGQETDICS